jgi:hypothetical protein
MMVEESPTPAATAPHCPWCGAAITPGAAMCATCGAALVEPDGALPGVNALDPRSISRSTRTATPAQRSKLISWLTGAYPDEEQAPAPPGSLAPPAPEVRREMLRLELEAEYANLQAEAQALVAEAEAEAREHGQLPAASAGEASVARPDDAPPATVAEADRTEATTRRSPD